VILAAPNAAAVIMLPTPGSSRAGDDNGGCDIRYEHRQDMLHAQRDRLCEWRRKIGISPLFRRGEGSIVTYR